MPARAPRSACRRYTAWATLLLAPLALSACAGWWPDLAHHEAGEHTDRMIIKYRSHAHADSIDAAAMGSVEAAASAAQVGVRHVRRMGSGSHIMKLSRRLSLARMHQMAADLRAANPDIEYAEPDRIMTTQFEPDDPGYPRQWPYSDPVAGLNLPAAWELSTGAGITVAVVDTGYRPHADLVANLVPGYDFITSPVMSNDGAGRDDVALDPGDGVEADECGSGAPARASSWHGTHVAGTIAAVTHNGVGVAGVAPRARVQPVRALGRCGGFTSDIADAILWAAGGSVPGVPANATPSQVINLSLGSAGSCGLTTQLAIDFARSRGSVVVVAAGNAGADAANFSPASCNGVISVGAVNRSGAQAYYSNHGATVDVSAPGGDLRADPTSGGIYSTFNTGTRGPGEDTYAYKQGTSMAAPHVAGVVALMLARNPAMTPDAVEAALKANARALPVPCSNGCGTGIVDARAAVQSAIDSAVPATPPALPPSLPPAPASPGSGTSTVPPAQAPATASTRTIKEVEPNGSLATAQRINAPATITGSLAGKTDTDYYRVVVAPGHVVEATLLCHGGADYDLYAYDDSGELIASSRMPAGVPDNVTLDNRAGRKPMPAYLRVVWHSGGTGAKANRYSLTLLH